MDELEAIVRAVADPEVWVHPGAWCIKCGALVEIDTEDDSDYVGTMREPHDDDCPFGRAVAWVAAHPEAK